MKKERRPKEISHEVLDAISRSKLIGIHGPTSSGKSFLTREICDKISRATHIPIDDDFLSDDQTKSYLDRVKTKELYDRIIESSPPVLVDGIIALDILERINIKPDLMLYCERTNPETLRFNPNLETMFDKYRERRQPEDGAKQVFTLNIAF